MLVLVLVGFVLYGCEKEKPVDLGNGYAFFTTNAENHYIVLDGQFVVDTDVVEYRVTDAYIVGLRKRSSHPDVGEHLISDTFGHFALNMETGKLVEGLSKAQLESIIEEPPTSP